MSYRLSNDSVFGIVVNFNLPYLMLTHAAAWVTVKTSSGIEINLVGIKIPLMIKLYQ